MSRTRGTPPIVVVPLLLLGACGGTGDGPADRESGTEGSEETVASVNVDPSARFALAGISTLLQLDIPPVIHSELEGDTLGRPFHVFLERCGGCHQVPAPGSKPATEWRDVVDRMRTNVEYAGLMPFSTEERDLILGFLGRHGS